MLYRKMYSIQVDDGTEAVENYDDGPQNRIGFGELRVQPHTTPSPIIVVPTKFEDIFSKPLVIVRGKNGNPDQMMTTEEFNEFAKKGSSALDRARETVRNQINNPRFEQILNNLNPSLLSTTTVLPHKRK